MKFKRIITTILISIICGSFISSEEAYLFSTRLHSIISNEELDNIIIDIQFGSWTFPEGTLFEYFVNKDNGSTFKRILNIYKNKYPTFNYGRKTNWKNPLSIAYIAGYSRLADFILISYPDLINIPDLDHSLDTKVPLNYVIERNDIESLKAFIGAGAQVIGLRSEYFKKADENPILLFSNNEIASILIKNGFEEFIEFYNCTAECNDSNVNVRSAPKVGNNVLLKLNPGDTVKVLKESILSSTIGNWTGHWCLIEYQGTMGWCLSRFLNQSAF